MSTDADDLSIRQPAAREDDDALLPLRVIASLVVGFVVANTAILEIFGVGVSAFSSSTADTGQGILGTALVAGLALPFLIMLWGAASMAEGYLLRRDLPCIVATVVSLAWLAFGS